MIEMINQFVGLYVHVFEEYPLAASVTTLLFVIAYFVWMIYTGKPLMEFSKPPALILFVGWLILTPLLGLIVNILVFLKDILASVLGLYVYIFEASPAAGGIVTLVFIGLYFIWKLITKKWPPNTNWLLAHPGIVLIVAWLVVTPIIGLVLKWVEPNP